MSNKYVAPIWPIGYAPLAVRPLLYTSIISTSEVPASVLFNSFITELLYDPLIEDVDSFITFTVRSVVNQTYNELLDNYVEVFNSSHFTNDMVVPPQGSEVIAKSTDVESLLMRNGCTKISIPVKSPTMCATTINVPKQSYRYDGFV